MDHFGELVQAGSLRVVDDVASELTSVESNPRLKPQVFDAERAVDILLGLKAPESDEPPS